MKKALGRVKKILVASVLAFSVLFPVLAGVVETSGSAAPIQASAESVNTLLYNRLDDNFEIEQGAAVNPQGYFSLKEDGEVDCGEHSDALTKLKYTLNLKNPKLYDFCDHDKDLVILQWTVYKDNGLVQEMAGDSDVREVRDAEAKFSVRCHWNNDGITWMHKVVEYDEDLLFNGLMEFTVDQKQAPDGAEVIDYTQLETEYYTADGYRIDWTMFSEEGGRLLWDDENTPEVGFFIQLGSPYSSYFVDFEYSYKNYVKTIDHWIFGPDEIVYSYTNGRLTSDVRSIYGVLEKMQEYGALEEELACKYTDGCTKSLEKGQEILLGEPKSVKVEYLKRIPGTPFAEKVQAIITVPVAQNTIYKDDVQSQLGRDALKALNSAIKEFVWDEEQQLYQAEYLKNIWIEARDMEGHTYNYYLDCNKSYYDYYNELKNDCGFSDGMYEYMLGQIVKKYEVLSGYDAADTKIYGYFGYTVIPDQPLFGSFDSMWEEIFGSNKKSTGGIQIYSYVEKLSASAYDVLLAQYRHSWLNRTWNQVITVGGQLEEFEATHYFFWADDISTDKVVFSENGTVASGDTDGIMQNEITELVKDAAAEAGVKLENLSKEQNNGGQEIWDTVIEVSKGILTTTLIAAASILGISVLVKIIKPKLKSKKKKKNKKGKSDPKPKEPKEPKDKQDNK